MSYKPKKKKKNLKKKKISIRFIGELQKKSIFFFFFFWFEGYNGNVGVFSTLVLTEFSSAATACFVVVPTHRSSTRLLENVTFVGHFSFYLYPAPFFFFLCFFSFLCSPIRLWKHTENNHSFCD